MSRRGRAIGPIDEELANLGLRREIRLTAPTFHSSIFALLESDLVLPIAEHSLWRLDRLGFALRQFDIPLPLKSVVILQAWHPRFDNDPAHSWLRQTVKRVCIELRESSGLLS